MFGSMRLVLREAAPVSPFNTQQSAPVKTSTTTKEAGATAAQKRNKKTSTNVLAVQLYLGHKKETTRKRPRSTPQGHKSLESWTHCS